MALTLARPVHSELLIRKSRFLGCVQPVAGRAEAQAVVCVPYALEGMVRRELHAAGAVLGEVRHGDVVEVAFEVAEDAAAAVRQRVDDEARGAAEWV